MAGNEVRVRRPAKHEALVQQMREEGGFGTLRDVLLFAAGLGVRNGRRSAFEGSNEPIRYEILTDPPYADALVSMVAAIENESDPEILDGPRLQERVTIFEEYANGGLGFIQEELNTRNQPIDIVLAGLVTDALSAEGRAEPASIADLLEGF